MKRVTITLVVVLVTVFMSVGVTSSTPYDAWYDFDDDGDIDIYDIVDIAGRYGTTGTPINKTALLLELQARMDALNTTVMALEDQMIGMQAYANVEVLSTTGTGTLTIGFPFNFSSPPEISVTGAILSGANLGKPLCITSLTSFTDYATLDLQYWDGYVWNDLGSGVVVQVSYTAVELAGITILEAFTADTVNTVTDTSGNVDIFYPIGYFTSTPNHLAVTAQFNSGGVAQMGHVTVTNHDMHGFTINVKDGTGSNWMGNVQVSYTAMQTSTL